MKRFAVVAGALCALLLFTAAAFAQNPTITIDENGNGDNPAGAALSWFVGADPGPGGLSNALIYQTLLNVTAGDLVMTEPADPAVYSDIVRFNVTSYGAQTVFYSDPPEPGETPPLADIGFPTGLYANVLYTQESGPETGPNGLTYTPAAGQPGYDASVPNLTYQIISDPATTPEPGSLAALASGLIGLAGLALKKKR